MAVSEVSENTTIVEVKVVPGSSRDQLAGLLGDKVKVKISAPAEKGKANAGLVKLLAGVLGVSKTDVKVISGHTSAVKQVQVTGAGSEHVRRKLGLEQQVNDG